MKRAFLCVVFGIIQISACLHAAPTVQSLPNGMRVIVAPGVSRETVSLVMLIKCSVVDEILPLDVRGAEVRWAPMYGLRQVLLRSMLQGSLAADGTTIQRALDDVGGVLEGRISQDALEFSVTVPADALGIGIAALAEIVRRPQLSDTGVTSAIAQVERALNEEPLGAVALAKDMAHRALFSSYPYAAREIDPRETVQLLDPALVRFTYPFLVSPEITVIAVAGCAAPTEANALVQQFFGEWRRGPTRDPRYAATLAALTASPVPVVREEDVQSACVLMSFPVCGTDDPEFATLRVIEALLGGGTGSIFFREVRDARQLAYEIAALLPRQLAYSAFTVYALTDVPQMERTREALATSIMQLQVAPVTETQLQRAKAFVIGSRRIGQQSTAIYAQDLAWATLCGQDDDAINTDIDAVTAADVQRIARKYFTHHALVVVMPRALGTRNE